MKTVLITGINRGLGKELYEQFLAKGYFIFGLLRNEAETKNLKHENSEFIIADLGNDDCTQRIKEKINGRKVDLIINNAGIGGTENKLENLKTKELTLLFNIHCLGVIRVLQAFSEDLATNNDITVLNINSRLGSIERQGNGTYKHLKTSYAYRIAKASQNMLTNCLKAEFENINFISLMPGKLLTDISSKDADTLPSESAKKIVALWESNKLVNGNGILELNENYIEW